MKYLCLVFIDEKKLEALPKNESQALTDESLNYDDTLRGSGHLLAAQALEPVHAAGTVLVQNGKHRSSMALSLRQKSRLADSF